MKYRRIGDLRVDHDLTQQQVADLLGCHREVYRRYEKGYRDIPLWALILLSMEYHVTIDYLLGMSDQKTPSDGHKAAR